jgi:diguanylate cyclase (GGDEF)-like protein/PAS domain S-box-containing protein
MTRHHPSSADRDAIERWASLLEATLDSTEDGILVVDNDLCIVTYNRRFKEIWGLDDALLEDARDDEAIDAARELLIDPGTFERQIRALYAEPEREGFDVLAFRDGRVIERYSRPQRIGDQVVGRVWSFRDVTRSRNAEEALRESEHRYRFLFDSTHSAIYLTTADGRFLDVNQAMLDLLGYTRDELMSTPVQTLYVDVSERDRLLNTVERHGAVRDWEVRLRRHDGSEIDCLLSTSLHRDTHGVPIGYQGVVRDVTAIKQREAALLREAHYDALTNLASRRSLLDKLRRALERAKLQTNYSFALLFIDLDDFKLVNDEHGHLVGDELLVAVARRVEKCLRPEDTIGRLGGDELAAILYQVDAADEARTIASRLRNELGRPYDVDGRTIEISASIGIAMSDMASQLEDLLRAADEAMYRSKKEERVVVANTGSLPNDG